MEGGAGGYSALEPEELTHGPGEQVQPNVPGVREGCSWPQQPGAGGTAEMRGASITPVTISRGRSQRRLLE